MRDSAQLGSARLCSARHGPARRRTAVLRCGPLPAVPWRAQPNRTDSTWSRPQGAAASQSGRAVVPHLARSQDPAARGVLLRRHDATTNLAPSLHAGTHAGFLVFSPFPAKHSLRPAPPPSPRVCSPRPFALQPHTTHSPSPFLTNSQVHSPSLSPFSRLSSPFSPLSHQRHSFSKSGNIIPAAP